MYGIWFFLAVEGVPLAAEEARDPRRDMPRGIIAAVSVLLAFAVLILVLAPGGAGAGALDLLLAHVNAIMPSCIIGIATASCPTKSSRKRLMRDRKACGPG